MAYNSNGGGWGEPANNQDDFFPNNFDGQLSGLNLNDGDETSAYAQSLTSFNSKESKASRGVMSAPAVADADDYFLDKKKKASKKSSKSFSGKKSSRSLPTSEFPAGEGADNEFQRKQAPLSRSSGWEQEPSDWNRPAPNNGWDEFAAPYGGGNSFDSSDKFAPPFSTINVDHSADDVSRMPDPMDHMASFHGEMLQNFLQKSGQDDKMAMQTAMAFESFLQFQAKKNSVAQPREIEDDEETRMEAMEDLVVDDDTFAPDSSWENGTFVDPSNYDRSRRDPLQAPPGRSYPDSSHRPRTLAGPGRGGRPLPPGVNPIMEDRSESSRGSGNSRGENSRGAGSMGNSQGGLSRGTGSMNSRTPPVGTRISDHSRNSQPSVGPQGSNRPPPQPYRPQRPRPFEEQMGTLPSPHRIVVTTLKRNWEQGGHGGFPDEWYLLFAKCSPGMPFDYKAAWNVMKKFDRRYMTLNIIVMEIFLRSKIIFPCRGLKNKFGQSMFYMQARRFSPKEASVELVIDNLIYVMNCMMEDEYKGIGFILDLSDCVMHHFSVGYFLKLMIAIQGRKNPTRVEMFLIINQPNWFANMWGAVIKPMLHKDFREKTHRITFHDMKKFLAPEFERFLPSEIYCGKASSDFMVRGFIEERKILEADRIY